MKATIWPGYRHLTTSGRVETYMIFRLDGSGVLSVVGRMPMLLVHEYPRFCYIAEFFDCGFRLRDLCVQILIPLSPDMPPPTPQPVTQHQMRPGSIEGS